MDLVIAKTNAEVIIKHALVLKITANYFEPVVCINVIYNYSRKMCV